MASEWIIYKLCSRCHGDGVEEHQHIGNQEFQDIPCRDCNGEKYLEWGKAIKD